MLLNLYLAVLTGCLLYALWHRRSLDGPFKWLFALICITWIVEAIGYWGLVTGRNSNVVFHIFQPTEYALLASFFAGYFAKTRTTQLAHVSIISFAIFCFIDALFIEKINAINSLSFSVEAILLILWCAYYFYALYKQDEVLHIRQIPEFWICTGILFFQTGAFFLMGLLNYLTRTSPDVATKLYNINHLLNILLYSLYTIGFVCKVGQKESLL
ncbi:hypothetical protein BH09BAC4_BH09BAC4_29740 [soil metagenome]